MKVFVLVTSKCNLECKYCYEGNNKSNEDMTIDVARKTIDFIVNKFNSDKTNKPLTVIFHGGEPLLNFELIKFMTESIKQKIPSEKVSFDMTTNGTVMSDEISSFIKANIKNISVSIDGTKEAHDLNRVFSSGRGSYDIAIANSKKIISDGINVEARMTFNSKTVGSLCDGIELVLKNGFNTVVPVTDYYDELWDKNHIEVLKKQIDKLIKIKTNYPEKEISLIDLEVINRKLGDCFGGFKSFCIDEKGNIYPCAFCVGKNEFKIGNVEDKDILEVELDKLRGIYTMENTDCLGCTRSDNCNGVRCKILNKLITGEYTVPPAIICATQKVHIDTIKKLI